MRCPVSDTTTPRMDEAKELSRIYSVTTQAEECIYKEGCKLERELAEAKAELECLRARKGHASGCSVMAYNSTGHCNCGYANIQEGKVIWGQLTAHKAALEKCEKALLATWDDLDHLNHWMPTPCRELYMEAKLEIAKLKGNK